MSKNLCTFSGKYGDILWSLATAKHISERIVNGKVDFAVMPYYESLLPLIQAQSYIDRAYIIKDWMRTHSNHGDQPWQPPQFDRGEKIVVKAFVRAEGDFDVIEALEYDRVWHLTYKGHPGISAPSMPLIDFIAYQQGISFNAVNPIPFLDAPYSNEYEKIHLDTGKFMDVAREGRLIAYAFNEQYDGMKKVFFEILWKDLVGEVEFLNVGAIKWCEAAYAIKMSRLFVGCRSANWVVAMGLGKQTVTYEPHPARNASGHLGGIFGCAYGAEFALPVTLPPEQAGHAVATVIKERVKKAVGVSA